MPASRSFRSRCPINITLELLGDRWSLLIVRDLMFKGRHSFSEFAGAEEHIATNVLSDRLHHLETDGIIASKRDPADGRRLQYRLTRKGIELAPLLVDAVLWAAKYNHTDAPEAQLTAMRNREEFLDDLIARWERNDD